MKIRRLILDCEVTPNVVYTWQVGYNLDIPPTNIINERKIICIGWKWEGESTVHCPAWDGEDDEKLLRAFVPVLAKADEIVGHNHTRFDMPWIKTRCVYHGIKVSSLGKEVDTLQWAKRVFRFNSNKLSYISEFLGVGNKIKTDFELWRGVMNGDDKALRQMIRYCKQDVRLTEDVFHKLQSYGPIKTHAGVFMGKDRISCNQCGSDHLQSRGQRISAQGYKTRIFQCQACGRWSNVPQTVVNTAIAKRDKLDGKKSKGKK